MHIMVGTQTVPLPDEAIQLHPLDSQTKVCTTSSKDTQTLSQKDYSPSSSKFTDLQSNSESEYISNEATLAQPSMPKITNSRDKSHDTCHKMTDIKLQLSANWLLLKAIYMPSTQSFMLLPMASSPQACLSHEDHAWL